ncbi:exo-alpha-sialidase [Oleiagrimonas sp. C23AA]|uniref:exo-alpha-sialidase n=1 Tax=Oleiagrimonas sp. C23AA TaxID=2719047 RepID=UPI0014242A5F|nr:exo-alpha-sialidase [Oleiagrimonas sp. C23AA]NII12193.1 exo-alpha-sialidase [Oleiagrimonas sp. C23AA]
MTLPRPSHRLLAALCACALSLPASAAALGAAPVTTIAKGTGYASLLRLTQASGARAKGSLMLAFEQPGIVGVPIYTRAHGQHWTLLDHVVDGRHADDSRWQLRWQPNLTQLRDKADSLPAGTLLLAANATGNTASGRLNAEDLQLYTSRDGGVHWHYRSSIVEGHGNPSSADNQGVWEPYIVQLDDGRLVAYYSSEQHKRQGFNQVLAHKVSSDGGRSWGKETIDVAVAGGVQRPGMATVVHLPDGRYVMAYEDIDHPHNGQVHLKFSRDGLHWGPATRPGIAVRTASGAWPSACPVIRWFPVGGKEGTLVISSERAGGGGDEDGHALYWNNAGGRGPWWEVPAPVAKLTGNIHAGWTQALMLRGDGRFLHITSSADPSDPGNVALNVMQSAVGRLDFSRYEAEDAARRQASAIGDSHASNGRRVRLAAGDGARLRFPVHVDAAGVRRVSVVYADLGLPGTPTLSVNGAPQPAGKVSKRKDGRYQVSWQAPMLAGFNRLDVHGGEHVLDVDYLELGSAGTK